MQRKKELKSLPNLREGLNNKEFFIESISQHLKISSNL